MYLESTLLCGYMLLSRHQQTKLETKLMQWLHSCEYYTRPTLSRLGRQNLVGDNRVHLVHKLCTGI